MTRIKRNPFDRSIGFNISMPGSWLAVLDEECDRRDMDRSALLRLALTELLPDLVRTAEEGSRLSRAAPKQTV
jgi:hypothetical protein